MTSPVPALLAIAAALLGVDRVLSRYTHAVPIHRSKALWVGVLTGVVVALIWLTS